MLGAVVGVIGSMQAVEAVKLILGVGKPLTARLMTVRRAGDDMPRRAVAGARTRLPGVRRASDHNHAGSGAIHPAGVWCVNDGDSAV